MRKPHRIAVLFAGFIGLACLGNPLAGAATYTATLSATSQQMVKGWGCMPGEQDTATNFLFLQKPLAVQAMLGDLGVSIVKIYVNGDFGNTDGGLPAAFHDVLDQIDCFQDYGLPYIMTVFTPPTGMKTVNVTGSNNAVLPTRSPVYLQAGMHGAFTAWIVNQMSQIAAEGYPLPLAVSIQNEPSVLTQWFGCIYTPSDYCALLKQVRAALDTAGYTSVLLLGPEDGSYGTNHAENNSGYFFGGAGFPALNDAVLDAAVGAFASHSYYFAPAPGVPTYIDQWVQGCDARGKDRWMTEYSYTDGPASEKPLTNHMDTAVGAARRLACDMAYIKNNYWFWWAGWDHITQLKDGTVLTEGDGVTTLTKSNTYYVLRELFQAVPPGSFVQRVSSTDPGLVSTVAPEMVSMDMVSFKNGTRNVVLLVNPDTASHVTNVSGLSGAVAEIHQTSGADQDLSLVASPAIVSGAISAVTLPARSVTVIKTTEQNLLANGGFDALMAGWSVIQGSGVVVSTHAQNGQGAAKVWGTSAMRQTVTTGFAPGDALTLSASGFLSAVELTGSAFVSATCVDGIGTVLSGTAFNYASELTYAAKRATFTVPAGTTAIWVQIGNMGGAANFYTDDVALVQANLLKNSGFESGTASWTVWSTSGSLAAGSPPSTPVHGGSEAVGMNGVRGMEQYLTDFTIGEVVTLSAWGRMSVSESGGGGFVGLYCFDAAGNTLQQAGIGYLTETAYTQKTATLVVPPGTVKMKAIAVNNNGPANFYVDDLCVLH